MEGPLCSPRGSNLRRLLFDLESNDLLLNATKIHCLVIKDVDTLQRWSCTDATPGYLSIAAGLEVLASADEIIGHNIMEFDVPVLEKLRGFKFGGKIRDTLLESRLIWTDISHDDFRRTNFPGRLIGWHSLEAWGHRLGVLKSGTGITDWSAWTPEMQKRCEQDVEVNDALRKHIDAQNYPAEAVELEHRFADIIYKGSRHGVRFDVDAAHKLSAQLLERKEKLEAELQTAFPPKVVEYETPKKKIKKTKLVPFNPGSRPQVIAKLTELGWEPVEFTKTGIPKLDDDILEEQGKLYPQSAGLVEYFLLGKRLGQIKDGEKAWLMLERAGRIHWSMKTNGAVTGRSSHNDPNISQVPKVGKPWGAECRACFVADLFQVLCGADASGIEARFLGHYLQPYDGGKFIDVVLNGDIHTLNMNAFGLTPGKVGRDRAKTGFYAKCYGAGPEKLGSNLVELAPEHEARAQSKTLPPWLLRSMKKKGPLTPLRIANAKRGLYSGQKIEKDVTGLGDLIERLRTTLKEKGYLRGLDGRRLRVRSLHSILNTLLQSAGALTVKKATVMWYGRLTAAGLVWDQDVSLVIHSHDEVQATCRPEVAELVGRTFVECIAEVGRIWNVRCPLTGEFKIGPDWKSTH
jgi:DNA polymerase I